MAVKKPIKKIAKPIAKVASKKAPVNVAPKKNAKVTTKKVAVKPVSKKSAKPLQKQTANKVVSKSQIKVPAKKDNSKSILKPTSKKTALKVVVKKSAKKETKKVVVSKKIAKSIPKKSLNTKLVKPLKVEKKIIVSKVKPSKAIVKPVKVEKIKVEKPKKIKVEKPKKAPKPEKIKKPAPPVLSAKEIAKQKAAAREALEKELSKKMPDPPPPPIHKRKVEDKNKKPIVIPKVTAKTSQPYKPEFTKSIMDSVKHKDTGPLVRYSDTELAEFMGIINKKLDSAKRELSYLQGLITRKDETSGDSDDGHYMTMEDGSMSMEREQLSQMASRQITYIDHLEKASMRIENKTYGICRVTGKLIDKARLKAVPHATLSIEAKMMQK